MSAIREDSYDDGLTDAARKMMKNLKLTAAEALNALEVPENQQGDYLKKLESNTNEGESTELYAHDTTN